MYRMASLSVHSFCDRSRTLPWQPILWPSLRNFPTTSLVFVLAFCNELEYCSVDARGNSNYDPYTSWGSTVHSRRRCALIGYNGMPQSPPSCPFPFHDHTPSNTPIPQHDPTHHPKWHPHPVSRIATIHFPDRQTGWDRQQYCVPRALYAIDSERRAKIVRTSDCGNVGACVHVTARWEWTSFSRWSQRRSTPMRSCSVTATCRRSAAPTRHTSSSPLPEYSPVNTLTSAVLSTCWPPPDSRPYYYLNLDDC